MTISNLDATSLFPYPTEQASRPAPSAGSITPSLSASSAADARAVPGSGSEVESKPVAIPASELADSVKKLNIELNSYGLQFEISDTDNRLITKVIDRDSGELIRQIPSEEALRLARSLEQSASLGGAPGSGLLVQTTA